MICLLWSCVAWVECIVPITSTVLWLWYQRARYRKYQYRLFVRRKLYQSVEIHSKGQSIDATHVAPARRSLREPRPLHNGPHLCSYCDPYYSISLSVLELVSWGQYPLRAPFTLEFHLQPIKGEIALTANVWMREVKSTYD